MGRLVTSTPTRPRTPSVSSRGTLQADSATADAGKTVHNALVAAATVSTCGETGPWSEVCSATVTA